MTESATPNFSLDLSNEVALVTGTTSGLGRRFAQILAAIGHVLGAFSCLVSGAGAHSSVVAPRITIFSF